MVADTAIRGQPITALLSATYGRSCNLSVEHFNSIRWETSKIFYTVGKKKEAVANSMDCHGGSRTHVNAQANTWRPSTNHCLLKVCTIEVNPVLMSNNFTFATSGNSFELWAAAVLRLNHLEARLLRCGRYRFSPRVC